MKTVSPSISNKPLDTSPEKFVEIVKVEQPHMFGLSALLTTTMPAMRRTIDALVEWDVRDKVEVMIGGEPITQTYANEIGELRRSNWRAG